MLCCSQCSVYNIEHFGVDFCQSCIQDQGITLYEHFVTQQVDIIASIFSWSVCLTVLVFSLSRILTLYINYNAPLDVYSYLYEVELQRGAAFQGNQTIHICTGKEWYRFPR